MFDKNTKIRKNADTVIHSVQFKIVYFKQNMFYTVFNKMILNIENIK